MNQKRFKSLGRKGWSVVLALFLLALVMAPMAVDAKKPAPIPPQNQTLDQILSGLPNGQPFKLLAQAIQFVEGQVSTLANTVTQLQQQVAALLAQAQSLKITSGFGTSAILSDVAPATEHVRLEVSFFRNDGTPPGAGLSYLMYAVVSVASPSEINFISAGNNGTQTASNAALSGTATTIASIGGIADLVAITGATGVTFELHELGTTAGIYFVKIIK